jgi:Family of unknown function (DUF6492)
VMQNFFSVFVFLALLCATIFSEGNRNVTANTTLCLVDAVVLTTGKDLLAFEVSIQSSLKHLLDVRDYYIVTPTPDELLKKFSKLPWYSNRIHIIGEDVFPFSHHNVTEIMVKTVKQKGVYPLDDGKSSFEKSVVSRGGWFLQQLLKLYSGQVLGLHDFVLLDSDIVWFKDVRFVATCNSTTESYYYASSSQYHPSYMAILEKVYGFGPVNAELHRSGTICCNLAHCHNQILTIEYFSFFCAFLLKNRQ